VEGFHRGGLEDKKDTGEETFDTIRPNGRGEGEKKSRCVKGGNTTGKGMRWLRGKKKETLRAARGSRGDAPAGNGGDVSL